MDGMAKTTTTPVKDVEVEVITSDGDARYKPRMDVLERKALKEDNLTPVVMNMEANGASEPEIVQKVLDITITSELKKAMMAPCVKMDASGYTKSNAAAIGMKMVEMALDGNLGAIREVLNRTEGKVPNVTKNASTKVTMTGSIAELMSRIDNNKKD